MRATLKEIEAIVAQYVDSAKQAGTWNSSKDNLVGLVDKIAKTITIDGLFQDKLQVLDGEELEFGKTIEEYYQELGQIEDYVDDPENMTDYAERTLRPYYPNYEECAYSYTLGRKVVPTTLKYDDYQKAVTNADDLARVTNLVLKRLYDTYAMFKFGAKKQLVANAIDRCMDEMNAATATPFNAGAAIVKGTRYAVGTDVYRCVKDSAADTLANQVAKGALIKMHLIEKIPTTPFTDPEKGERFIEAIKCAAEDAEFASEGNALNGSTIGANNGLLLIIKKNIKPFLEVETMSGAFNPEHLAIPAQVVAVDTLPCADQTVDAILVDKRALRLHPTYFAVREQLNAKGDFVNYFLHSENTAFISKNTFMRVFKEDASVNP